VSVLRQVLVVLWAERHAWRLQSELAYEWLAHHATVCASYGLLASRFTLITAAPNTPAPQVTWLVLKP
jgi:hypothetical protein